MPKIGGKRNAANGAAAAGRAKKAGGAGAKPNNMKSKLYNMPEKIKEGTVLRDLMKTEWKIGPSIGTGGFGEIYSACRQGENKYDFVVKCEPHDNGPLFVEMHFYMRNAKLDDVRKFQNKHGLKSLGMPYMVGNGSAEINSIKHRFIVMPRYGSDVAKHFLGNGRRLPEGTCYRLALQMLDVYEFIHGCGYVHADLKAANILLGYGPKQQHQAYLVDFGLASHYTTKDFKPDPKKMHNGTIEYTSRDAHLGVATMRADFEILGYNLIEWLGIDLPWVRDKILNVPTKVQKSKEEFMADVVGHLKKLFGKTTPPLAIVEFMKYVVKLEYNETPDYEKCRKMFQNTLKSMKFPMTGDLEFKLQDVVSNRIEMPQTSKTKTPNNERLEGEIAKSKVKQLNKPRSLQREPSPVSDDSEVDIINASEDDDDDVIFEGKKSAKKETKHRLLKTQVAKSTPKNSPNIVSKSTAKISPIKANTSFKRKSLNSSSPKSSPSPAKRSRLNGSIASPKISRRTPLKRQSPSSGVASPRLRHTPISARANIHMSPSISMSSSRSGKTIINDRVTPNKKPAKTYEFNFELDVSMDANVIVNVRRKKKLQQTSQDLSNAMPLSKSTPSGSKSGTPATKINVRKVSSGADDVASPRTPAVTVKKSRRVIKTPT